MPARHRRRLLVPILLAAALAVPVAAVSPASAQAPAAPAASTGAPQVLPAAGFDTSRPLRALSPAASAGRVSGSARELPERGPLGTGRKHAGDAAVQATARRAGVSAQIAAPSVTFEGLANTDNPFLVAPPDPSATSAPTTTSRWSNLVFAVYAKTGDRLLGPAASARSVAGLRGPGLHGQPR